MFDLVLMRVLRIIKFKHETFSLLFELKLPKCALYSLDWILFRILLISAKKAKVKFGIAV